MDRHTLKVEERPVIRKFPSYNKPLVIGCFSLDSERNYCGDLRQLKYIQFPASSDVKFDLDLGRKHVLKKDTSRDEKLDELLRWMLQNPNDGNRYVFVSLLNNSFGGFI